MSRHRLVRNLDLADELDDAALDGEGDEWGAWTIARRSADGTDNLTDDQQRALDRIARASEQRSADG